MRQCSYCGSDVDDSTLFCPNCGSAMSQTTNNNGSNSGFGNAGGAFNAGFGANNGAGNNGFNPYTTPPQDTRDHSRNAGIAVISFLCLLAGLIIYFVCKDKRPGWAESAKTGMLCSLSFGFPIVGVILYFVWKNEDPGAARRMLSWGIAGFVLGIIGNLFSTAILAGLSQYTGEYAAALMLGVI